MRSELGSGILLSIVAHLSVLVLITAQWGTTPQFLRSVNVEFIDHISLALEAQAPIPAQKASKSLALPAAAPASAERARPRAAPIMKKVEQKKPLSLAPQARPAKELAQVTDSPATTEAPVTASASFSTTLSPGNGVTLAASTLGPLRASYEQAVAAKLERVKRYPRRALQRNLEGNVVLYLEIGRDGGVVEREIRQSSGFSFFDGEVLEMVERVGSFPRLPPEISSQSVAYLVPVTFKLR